MAFSQTIIQTKIPEPCNFCATDANVNWKCVQCKIIHLKLQTSITHDNNEVKISEAKKEKERTIITDNIPCHIHRGKLNCMFCRTCDYLVCPLCISDCHKKHNLGSIDTVYTEKMTKLKEFASEFSIAFTLCELEDSKVKDFKTKYNKCFDESIQKIYQQEQMIKDVVREYQEYAKALQNQLEDEKKRIENSITYKERQNKNTRETLLNNQSKLLKVLESNDAKQVLKFSAYTKCSANDIQDLSFKEFINVTKEFIPVKLKTTTNLFGSL
ncbi:Hypothetical predicted protein [Mytilus galloprovincialis]|uniref:B box-type domain-containing protein n=1 Tax=Mytilus galloprovincialis TaxID=29158 RepID=A0A8B6DI67_MYTGA|nr:Hypothetical predicted protein [Mytilus galloprovincialis]